ncbi:MAG: PEP-CTERM sorting domain-containing protein [Polyangiales bacterium]
MESKKRSRGYWLLELTVVVLLALFAFATIQAGFASAEIGDEFNLTFTYCGDIAGADRENDTCWIEPTDIGGRERYSDTTVFIDGELTYPDFPFEHGPNRLYEGMFTVVYDQRWFSQPRGRMVFPTLFPEMFEFSCIEAPVIDNWVRAECYFYDNTPWDEGLPIVDGAELAIDLYAHGRLGNTIIAYPPFGTSQYGHRNELAWIHYEYHPGGGIRIGDWKRIGPELDVEVVPAPEPGSLAMLASGGALLVTLARRKARA